MYGQKPIDDVKRVVHAILSNQIAQLAPRLYVILTGQTGRGREPETPEQIADYFYRCFDDYCKVLGFDRKGMEKWLSGKIVLEYGPGDIPGVALLMAAYGARKIICIDRFPLVSLSSKNVQVLQCILCGLDDTYRARAEQCFREWGNPASGFAENSIEYLVRPHGLSGLANATDLIISRAVLEHVSDLSASFADMRRALRADGMMVHQVDLKSHGLHRNNPLDFLTWPSLLWKWMYAGKGVPNRWRVDRYRRVIAENGFETVLMKPTSLADISDVKQVRPYLDEPFRNISDEDLSWLGFWLVCRKASAP